MSLLAPHPTIDPFGRYSRPEHFPAFDSHQNDFPGVNPFDQFQPLEPLPFVNSVRDSPKFNQAPFDQYTHVEPPSAYRPKPDRLDDAKRQRRKSNNRVAFRTPDGGYYTNFPAAVSTTPTLPQRVRQNEGPCRPRKVLSGLLNRFQKEPTTPRAESLPADPTMPRFPAMAPGRRQQIQQLLSLLVPHVPAAEPIIRPLLHHVQDSQLLQQLIDALSRPLTQQQREAIYTAWTIPQELDESIWAVNNPSNPDFPELLDHFREFVEEVSGRPYRPAPPPHSYTPSVPAPAPEEVPASTGGAFSHLSRLIPSKLRKSLQSPQQNPSQPANLHTISEVSVAQPMTEQQDVAEVFPIHELRESVFRRFIVEPFTCTKCGTNIPASRSRGAEPQLANLHLRCPNADCSTVFCRGCRRDVVACQPNCNARHSCSLRRCCADVRAMAILEYLSVFDEDYLTRVRNFHRGAENAHTTANRLLFLEHVFDPANQRDPRFRGFISVLKRTLKYASFWLEPSVPENVTCSAVSKMLATSFLLEVVRAFLKRGIENVAEFRARGYLIHRVVGLLSTLNRQRSGPLYDLVGSSPMIIDQSPGLRRLIWVSESMWEGHFPPGEDPTILEYMHGLWSRLERELGSEALRHVCNEFDGNLYERGHNLVLSLHIGPRL